MTAANRTLVTITGVLLVIVLATAAFAAFTATGTGTGTARSATMPSVMEFDLTYNGGPNVDISWEPATIAATDLAAAGGQYRVTRYAGLDATTGHTVCTVSARTSCTDTLTTSGTVYYGVQTVLHNWTGQSSPLDAVEVTVSGPSVDFDFPAQNGEYLLADWDEGCATPEGDICAAVTAGDATIASVEMSVRDADGFYWDGTAFDSVDPVLHESTTTPATIPLPSTALAVGDYELTVKAVDANENENSPAASFSIIPLPVEKVLPTVTITSPTSVPSTDTTVEYAGLAGTAEYHADVTVRVYSGNGTSGALVRTLPATRTDGTWAVADPDPLDPGTYTVVATQTCTGCPGDAHGVSDPVTLTITAPLPAVTITSPVDGTAVNSGKPTISGGAGTAAGDSSLIEVAIYAGTSAAGSPVKSATVNRGSAASWSWSASQGASLTEGAVYTVRASQTGTGGVSTATSTFRVDSTAPVATMTAPTEGLRTSNRRPVFSGSAGTATGDAQAVSLRVTSGAATVVDEEITRSGAAWAFTPASDLADGSYTATVTQRDDAGNASQVVTRTFSIDTTPPAVTLTNPTAGGVVAARPVFQGAAGNATGDLATITLRLYTGATTAGTPVAHTITRTGSAWSFTPPSNLADGQHTAVVVQGDGLQETTTGPVTFRVDGTAPMAANVRNSGSPNNLITVGEVLHLDFNEALKPSSLPTGNVVMTIQRGNQNSSANLTIAGVTQTGTTGVEGWVSHTNNTVTWNGSVALSADGKTITYTVGTCATGCTSQTPGGSGGYAFVPATSLQDLAGNGASGTAKTVTLQLF